MVSKHWNPVDCFINWGKFGLHQKEHSFLYSTFILFKFGLQPGSSSGLMFGSGTSMCPTGVGQWKFNNQVKIYCLLLLDIFIFYSQIRIKLLGTLKFKS